MQYGVMKTLVTTLTERGQVSVPGDVRKQMHLQPGQHLLWECLSKTECRIVIAPHRRQTSALSMLGYAKRFRPVRRTSEWMADIREGEA